MNLGKGRKFEKYDLSSADTDMRIWETTNFKNHVARIQVHIYMYLTKKCHGYNIMEDGKTWAATKELFPSSKAFFAKNI
jgi:hypothetical protein